MRTTLGTLTSAPWRRAPLLLLRRPGVLAAVAGSVAVLVAAVAAVPLFLSAAGSEALAIQVDERCAWETGAVVEYQLPLRGRDRRREPPRAAPDDPFGGRISALGRPLFSARAIDRLQLGPADRPGESTPVALMTRDRSVDHVEPVAEPVAQGAWLSDRAAERIGVVAGGRVVVSLAGPATPGARSVEVPIAGVFSDLAGAELDDYWCSQHDALDLAAQGDAPPPLLLVDRNTFFDLVVGLDLERATATWETALRAEELTLAEVDETAEQIAGMELEVSTTGGFLPTAVRSQLPFVIDRTRSIRTSVAGGVGPVAAFAALAGLALVGAAGALWFDRRRQEVIILAVRGVGPAAIGAKALLELLVALVAGTAAGWGLAYGLVIALGPSTRLEPAAVAGSMRWAVAASAAAAVLLWLVVAARARVDPLGRRRWRGLAGVPWELGLAAGTVVAYERLGRWGVPLSQGAAVSRVDTLGLLFPLLFLVSAVAVLARVMASTVNPVRSVSRDWPTPLFLAVRRIAASRVAAIGLVAASALAAGVFCYAATLTRSLNTTLDTKAKTFVGSDVAVRIFGDEPLPAALAGRATSVIDFHGARVERLDRAGDAVEVLAIDPDTFEQAAFWHDRFSELPLSELLERLSADPVAGRFPALVVGGHLPDDVDVELRPNSDARLAIHQVGEVRGFPGMRSHRPTVVVTAAAVAGFDLVKVTETWIEGDPVETLTALDRAGVGVRVRRDLASVVDRTSFLTVSWTFGFMQALGVATAFLIAGGLAVYLDARRRSRVLAYALARRMGLAPRSHRRALLLELTATMVVGSWLGLLTALTGARLAYGRIDPLPNLPPGPLLEVPLALVLALATATGGIATLASHLAQRQVDADSPVEVLRAGT